jgi:glycosyltransferase involved in cell wall biosynthesis
VFCVLGKGPAEVTPKLAVITSVFNHGQYLAECIASVRAQTEKDIEHVIVIDGATDDSSEIAERASMDDDRVIVWHNHKNFGLAYSLNFGIETTRASWVLKVDADDRIAPTYVEEILAAADEDFRRNVIFSPCQHFGARSDVYHYPAFDQRRMIDAFLIPGPAGIRRDLWSAVNGYDETLRFAEDWDFIIRAQLAVGLVPHQLPEPRWFYRMHSGQRASAEGIANLSDLQRYWRGHTRESVLAGSRSWGQWCAERMVAA